jgi:pimeloyl-ACP methyl ester carboxylesterase
LKHGACVLFLLNGACSYQPPVERADLERGYIMLFTGVECHGSYHEGFVRGLREGGIDCAIDVNEWGHKPFGTFRNLRNYVENREIAGRAAERIVAYAQTHPGRPVTVIGYSGGGAMALFLAEKLPEGFQVDRIILTAPAISPDYDIGPALGHSRQGIVSFYSPQDWFMAGIATEIWGTMDRRQTATAGHTGFRDGSGELLVHEDLTQISWIPQWRRLGHDGGHSGWRSRAWAREILAPMLK